MTNSINIEQAPIQRNRRDVAIELLKIYIKDGNRVKDELTAGKIIELYKKYHWAAIEADKGL